MTPAEQKKIVKWFEKCGKTFVKAYWSSISAPRLKTDNDYGLKVLLFTAAFARSNVPKAYHIAAIKAVSRRKDSSKTICELFKVFRPAQKKNSSDVEEKKKPSNGWNEENNPALDPRIEEINIPNITSLVRKGKLGEAFTKLKLNGMGDKIRALFLRDLVMLLKAEHKLDRKGYELCQPIDVWVCIVVETLCGIHGAAGSKKSSISKKRYQRTVDKINQLSHEAHVCPLKVNAGIWYFSSNVVQNEKRLKKLIRTGDVRELKRELKLMEGFLPVRPSWG